MNRVQAAALSALLVTVGTATVNPARAADAARPDTVITPLLEAPLSAFTAPTASMITVEYAPGAGTPPHTHPADTFVYVLEGAIEMQVTGGELKVLHKGDTFHEKPTDQHIVSRNASKTDSAKFLVMFVKDKQGEVLVPLKPADVH